MYVSYRQEICLDRCVISWAKSFALHVVRRSSRYDDYLLCKRSCSGYTARDSGRTNGLKLFMNKLAKQENSLNGAKLLLLSF